MRLKDQLLLLKDMELPEELTPSSKEETLIVRQLNNLKEKLIHLMEVDISRPSKRYDYNLYTVAYQETLILVRRISSAKEACGLSQSYERKVLDFYQSMMVKSTLQNRQVYTIWSRACLAESTTKNQRVTVQKGIISNKSETYSCTHME